MTKSNQPAKALKYHTETVLSESIYVDAENARFQIALIEIHGPPLLDAKKLFEVKCKVRELKHILAEQIVAELFPTVPKA